MPLAVRGPQLKKNDDRVSWFLSVSAAAHVQCSNGQQQTCGSVLLVFGFTGWVPFEANLCASPLCSRRTWCAVGWNGFLSRQCWAAAHYRLAGVKAQGAFTGGDSISNIWLCGRLGLSAIMIAAAVGLSHCDWYRWNQTGICSIGAAFTINARGSIQKSEAVKRSGVYCLLDAFQPWKPAASRILRFLRKQETYPALPYRQLKQPATAHGRNNAKEPQLIGSHGMQAHQWPCHAGNGSVPGKWIPKITVSNLLHWKKSPWELTDFKSAVNTGVAGDKDWLKCNFIVASTD